MLKLFSVLLLFLISCLFVEAQQVYTVTDYGQCDAELLNKALSKSDLKRYQQKSKIIMMNIDCGAIVQIHPIHINRNNLQIIPLRNTFILNERGFLGEKVNTISKTEYSNK